MQCARIICNGGKEAKPSKRKKGGGGLLSERRTTGEVGGSCRNWRERRMKKIQSHAEEQVKENSVGKSGWGLRMGV